MCHRFGSKFVGLECSFSFLDDEAAFTREQPFIAVSKTDAAIAVDKGSYLWDLDVELEGSTVAVAIVCLELGGWICHIGSFGVSKEIDLEL